MMSLKAVTGMGQGVRISCLEDPAAGYVVDGTTIVISNLKVTLVASGRVYTNPV